MMAIECIPDRSVSPGDLFQGFVTRIRAFWRRRRDERDARMAFSRMLTLDDRMLEDVGYIRDEVRRAAALPLSRNASEALREMASRRRGTPRS